MDLTGACEKEFYYWLVKQRHGIVYDIGERQPIIIDLNEYFWKLPLSMQIGVLTLYFDSVGIVIEIQVHTEPTMQGAKFKKFRPEILANRTFNNVSASFGIRERAWTKAIERANELRNEQLNNTQ